jgi:capsular polysaccharide transport system ATP-binding protein
VIRLQNLSKTYMVNGVPTEIADDITVTFPTGSSVALMGRNGAGKSSLLKIISGVMRPTSGEVISDGTISWNVGFAGSFHPDLTGAQNVRFVARIYGVDTDALQAFVAEFAELGHHFHQPFRTYSAGMRSRLAFGVSMGIRFDTYLIDEVTSVGDAAFRARSEQILRARLQESSAIVVSHSVGLLRQICTSGAVLEAGKLQYFDDVEEAIEVHSRNMAARIPA